MIKFAVIGQGHIGKRHAEMIRRDPDSELVAVCDVLPKDATGCNDVEVPYFASIDELLNADLQIDVINICTPNAFHAPYAIKALEAGKHVVIEKPVALSKADAEKVLFKSLQMSRYVWCVMQNRYSPPSVWLKEVMQKRLLGNIYMVKLDCFWNRDERYYKPDNWHGTQALDGGTLFTQFSHFIDIMYWLFGDIRNIRGNFADFNHQTSTDFEDSGVVTFDFVNGGMGCLNYSTAVYDTNLESSMTIIGEKGTIKVSGQYMNEVVYCHIKDYQMPELAPCNPANDYGAYKGSAQNHHYVIQNVVQTLNRTNTITTNLLEGLKVVDIIERIYEVRNAQWVKQGGKV
ncbi:MAG: Gfo/Idh/MocA family oxidoreductase [Paludibacter sp.]|nr:Gfo/Idh/MocA family oxidoreductase [Bacteroidales bacterium]MCM1069118.1 Gfo/Idh/MocA family oxidoreductase [Prevotella sp.]MCM1353557.1 Gfo/Idh/MocA family oxidoreductase [Bacteroides sp.]MCM1442718.1 Gfo/Idh/MocA family oxidoreductase [Muribaculum sp.]MCM1481646.1 Gfo/Idh/MocA family oxidoreductase [Paludibacter sp.]